MGENTKPTGHLWSPWAIKPDGTCVKKSDVYWRKPLMWNAKASRITKGVGSPQSTEQVRSFFMGGESLRPRVFLSLIDPFEDWGGLIVNAMGVELRYFTAPGPRQIMAPADYVTVDPYGPNTVQPAGPAITMSDLRRDMFDVIDQCQNLDFILATKRPENIRRMWTGDEVVSSSKCTHRFLPRRENCWLLYSASDQASLEAGIGHLFESRDLSLVLGLSLEPLIGPIDLSAYNANAAGDPNIIQSRDCLLAASVGSGPVNATIDWVEVGGESGPNARPCQLEWILDIVQQCKAAGVPIFVKQVGANSVTSDLSAWDFPACTKDRFYLREHSRGVRIDLVDKKGGDPKEWPKSIRVQQYPKVTS